MARYKRETLEAKTVRDLRQLVVKLGIPGQTKKPKSVIIDAIMAKYGVGGASAAVTACSARPLRPTRSTNPRTRRGAPALPPGLRVGAALPRPGRTPSTCCGSWR